MKTLLLLFLMSVCSFGQTLSLPDTRPSVISLAEHDAATGWYRYHYLFDQSKFLLPRELSNFYFTVCADTLITDIQTKNVTFYDTDLVGAFFKFDDFELVEDEALIYFSFLSNSTPKVGDLTYKFGNYSLTESEWVPSCNIIPEPSTFLLGTALLVPFSLRRRR
jgi:hypothetical protein